MSTTGSNRDALAIETERAEFNLVQAHILLEKIEQMLQKKKKLCKISHLWNISPIDDDSLLEKIAKQKRARKGDRCNKSNVSFRKALFNVDNYWM
jgi:hypothetical protein